MSCLKYISSINETYLFLELQSDIILTIPSMPAEHSKELSTNGSLGSGSTLFVKLAFPIADQSNAVTFPWCPLYS